MGLFRRKPPPVVPRPVGGTVPAPARVDERLVRDLLAPLGAAADRLWATHRPAVEYAVRPLADGEPAPLGASRIGGLPDLPSQTAWPEWTGPDGSWGRRLLQFYAQVDLGAAAGHVDLGLPPEGQLLFFADFDWDDDQMLTGLYADELAGARVLYAPAVGTTLVRTPPPGRVTLVPEALLAPVRTLTFDGDRIEDDELYDAYDAFDTALAGHLRDVAPDGFALSGRHQLGGHAREIQRPVETEALQAAAGAYTRQGGFDAARWEVVKEQVGQWSMLFQLDTEDELDLMFGDCGTLWWVAPKRAIATRVLRETRFVFQCS